jgi:hypothetical protein
VLGENQLKHCIPEKLEALIVEMVTLRLVAKTRMSQSFSQ